MIKSAIIHIDTMFHGAVLRLKMFVETADERSAQSLESTRKTAKITENKPETATFVLG